MAPNQNPEQIARDRIDAQLSASGWSVQDRKALDWNQSQGIAIREYPTADGPVDYMLFVDQQAVGVIEAKRAKKAENITTVEAQSTGYAEAAAKFIHNDKPKRFVYEATGEITRFTDRADPAPRSREVFSFHRPETLAQWLKDEDPFRKRLQSLPMLQTDGLRECQIEAIRNLEKSLMAARPRALVQMATGSGKTFTAITSAYRLLKHAKAKRILFLVDTKNLGEQAEQEFISYVPNDDNRKFTELYNVHRLKTSSMPRDSEVYISTVQRLYSMLKGEELAEGAEDTNPAEISSGKKEPLPVVYNEKIPPEFFDVIIIDECHRSIYNLWRQVIEYFDSFLVGLTATPDNRTFGFFKNNVVSEYTHEKAVRDGVNVGNEVYLIETAITQKGATLKKFQQIQKREKMTRKRRWEQQDENEAYSGSQLDRDVVNADQIRTVIKEFKRRLPEIFPGRSEVPKTLIFAKTDSHADDIINTVREEFGEGNDFCKKVTYQAKEDPKSILAQFRNDYNPRIAVTVDMIATGTDVKPLECLLFMRDVKSKNYFEQMKGRGTRTLDHDDLKKVTPSAATSKTHYVIVDAVGVTTSVKTASQPLITKPSVSFKDLATQVLMGARDEDTLSSLAGRLSRLSRQLDEKDHEKVQAAANGTPLQEIVDGLFEAIDPDVIETRAKALQADDGEPTPDLMDQAQKAAADKAAKPFTGTLIETLDTIRREKEQTIDHENLDTVLNAGWQGGLVENAGQMVKDFEAYLADNREELLALQIYYDQPARRAEVTFGMIRDVFEKLKQDRPTLSPVRVWQAYAALDKVKAQVPEKELRALVALIRRATGMDEKIARYSDQVAKNFQSWVLQRHAGAGPKFTEEQMAWLRMIRDHIAESFHLDRDDLDLAPFNAQGGLGRMYQLFGEQMDPLVEELNGALTA